MSTTFPLVASGWRAGVTWAPEAQYGLASVTTGDYKWVGAVQEIHATVDKQPILVYRMDGMTDYPAYLLRGQRNVELVITYVPQDINLLNDVINQVGTANAVSHTFEIYNYDTQTYYLITGCIANTITINGTTGDKLSVQVDYWGQQISQPSSPPIVYTSFPTDPGTADATDIPFFFTQESVQVPSGTPKPQTLNFTGTITNNLQRVFQFGLDYVRVIPTLLRTAEGTLTATFDAFDTGTYDQGYQYEANVLPTAQATGSNNETTYTDPETAPTGLSQQTISLQLGVTNSGPTTYYLNYTGAVLPKIDLDTRIDGLVALVLEWTATGASITSFLYTGVTTGATSTILTDTTQTFTVNALAGDILSYNSGPASGQNQVITSNTATTITTAAFNPAPSASGDQYSVT
jgi:hypothetical protein